MVLLIGSNTLSPVFKSHGHMSGAANDRRRVSTLPPVPRLQRLWKQYALKQCDSTAALQNRRNHKSTQTTLSLSIILPGLITSLGFIVLFEGASANAVPPHTEIVQWMPTTRERHPQAGPDRCAMENLHSRGPPAGSRPQPCQVSMKQTATGRGVYIH